MGIIFIIAIVLFANIEQSTTNTQTPRKCYVCGLEAPEPFKYIANEMGKSMSVSSCDEFDQSSDLEQFAVECPKGYVGCITQIDDISVTRTCDILAINDCQTANGVKYCYCNTDLCNKKFEPQTKRHKNFINLDTTDDEDMLDIEASGSLEEETSYDDHSESISSTNSMTKLFRPTISSNTVPMDNVSTIITISNRTKQTSNASMICISIISKISFLSLVLIKIWLFR